MRVYRFRGLDFLFSVGPYISRLTLSRHGTFSCSVGDGKIKRFIRRFWTGWMRMDEDELLRDER